MLITDSLAPGQLREMENIYCNSSRDEIERNWEVTLADSLAGAATSQLRPASILRAPEHKERSTCHHPLSYIQHSATLPSLYDSTCFSVSSS